MFTLTLDQRHARLAGFIADRRLIRKRWSDTDQNGRELACLWVALVPEAGKDTTACPADLMPVWLADRLPEIDDCGTAGDVWLSMVRRFALVLRRASVILDSEAWARLERVHAALRAKFDADNAALRAKFDADVAVLHDVWTDGLLSAMEAECLKLEQLV